MSNVVGENLKRIRKERGITQAQFAKDIGYSSQQALARIENADHTPRYEVIEKIAKELKIDVFELLATDERRRMISNTVNEVLPADEFSDTQVAFAEEVAKKGYIDGYKNGSYEAELISFFRALNDEGKREALKRTRELMEIKRYID